MTAERIDVADWPLIVSVGPGCDGVTGRWSPGVTRPKLPPLPPGAYMRDWPLGKTWWYHPANPLRGRIDNGKWNAPRGRT